MKWHYTNGRRIDAILSSGILKPSSDGSGRIRPAVWFSTNQSWEETANRAVRHINGSYLRCDREQTDLYCDGLFRLEIDADQPLLTWRELAAMCGMRPGDMLKIEALARRLGSDPQQWCASLRAIGRNEWNAIERWNGFTWESVEAYALTSSFATRLAG
ncbi:hypothetical protein LOC68_03830 [Blastopirellula sp. JC732]|uniref:Uncharacterized protein n=1 Tax=Blastopirellula sediminis TaxID=2894196 RepID=A0A9X1MJJ8_9BACT|nr:hypothetical protein [Blastopirellula sediminis]MCC9609712.1 hypothetical protein [Blastopirellula sediminis]MCC9627512.1 hypothetical protein [Blastopirellula sediminis]